MTLLLHFHPQSVFDSKDLTVGGLRLQKTLNPLDDFGIGRERTGEMPQLGAVSLTLARLTLKASLAEHLTGAIYAVNWPVKLDRPVVVYATMDYTILGAFLVNEMFPILFVDINWIDAQGNYIVRDAGQWVEDYLDDPRINRLSLFRRGSTHANGGAHMTLDANVLSHLPAIDFAVRRESEFAMLALVNGKEPATISSVVSRAGLRLINDGDAEVNRDIDQLPFPERDGFWGLTGEGFVTHRGSLGARVMEIIK